MTLIKKINNNKNQVRIQICIYVKLAHLCKVENQKFQVLKNLQL